ncbi:hypothetical protein, partial [Klebsiella pneumoniae]
MTPNNSFKPTPLRGAARLNSGVRELGKTMRDLLKVVLSLVLAMASGQALADLPIVLVDEARLPYDYSPSNYDISPSNYDNSISNYDNSPSNYDNSESNYDGTVAKLAMRQPFVLFKGLTFQKLCLP